MEKKCKKAKWLSEKTLQIAVKGREAKSKRKKERYTHLNAEFQRIARRDKKAFLSDQCKEIEENNRMGNTRDLLKKIRDPKELMKALFQIKTTVKVPHIRVFFFFFWPVIVCLLLLLLLSHFSRVRLCATPWTTAYQAPPSMGFSRQEYWSGVPSHSPERIYKWQILD